MPLINRLLLAITYELKPVGRYAKSQQIIHGTSGPLVAESYVNLPDRNIYHHGKAFNMYT
jgi:hypothetical protein